MGEGAAAGAAGVRGGDGVGQQRRTVGPRDRENAAGRRELDSPKGEGDSETSWRMEGGPSSLPGAPASGFCTQRPYNK